MTIRRSDKQEIYRSLRGALEGPVREAVKLTGQPTLGAFASVVLNMATNSAYLALDAGLFGGGRKGKEQARPPKAIMHVMPYRQAGSKPRYLATSLGEWWGIHCRDEDAKVDVCVFWKQSRFPGFQPQNTVDEQVEALYQSRPDAGLEPVDGAKVAPRVPRELRRRRGMYFGWCGPNGDRFFSSQSDDEETQITPAQALAIHALFGRGQVGWKRTVQGSGVKYDFWSADAGVVVVGGSGRKEGQREGHRSSSA